VPVFDLKSPSLLALSDFRWGEFSRVENGVGMTEVAKTRWIVPKGTTHAPEWKQMGQEWGIPMPILDLLWQRGLRERSDVESFLKPSLDGLHDPFLMTDLSAAVDQIWKTIQDGERIFIFGDYDVDGISSAALLIRVLRRYGADLEYMIPNRLEDGYGLSVPAAQRAYDAGAKLLISADCGTSSHAAIERLNELGVRVVVCDHHMPDAKLPRTVALVNPRRPGDVYPFPDLAAVGVVFKVLQGLVSRYGDEEDRRFLLNQLDLVAMGTIADVVPLVSENRILAHFGVRILRVRRRAAFQALMDEAHLSDKFLESSHVAFSMAPRINAAGRLGTPEKALELLLSDELASARKWAGLLERDNTERRGLNERVQEESASRIAPDTFGREAIVLGSDDWHPGVVGIAASRLADQFRVPALLVSFMGGLGRGSARTPKGINLLELIETGSEFLTAFGGHRAAAGFSVEPDAFPPFQQRIMAESHRFLDAAPDPSLQLDGALDFRDCDLGLVKWLERLGPFGEGNREPIYYGEAECREIRVLKERHLKMRAFASGVRLDCIGFGLAEKAERVPDEGTTCRLAFTPQVNRFRGQEKVQLKLKEIDFV